MEQPEEDEQVTDDVARHRAAVDDVERCGPVEWLVTAIGSPHERARTTSRPLYRPSRFLVTG